MQLQRIEAKIRLALQLGENLGLVLAEQCQNPLIEKVHSKLVQKRI